MINRQEIHLDDARQRYEDLKRRQLSLMSIRAPYDRIAPEGFCITCKSYTTAYNRQGECSDCGTPVTADISEVEG